MGIRSEIEKKIRRKQEEIKALEVQIRETAAHVAGLEEALRLLPREGANDGGAEKMLRANTNVSRARDAILKAKKPLHIVELLRAMGEGVDKKNRLGLAGTLASYVRKGEIFTRPMPNTFGLIEIDTADKDDEFDDLLGTVRNATGENDDNEVPK